jgi:hypothetical protein
MSSPSAPRRGAGRGRGNLLQSTLEPKSPFAVALEFGSKALRRGEVLDREADEPVEGLDQVNVHLLRFVRAGALDRERVRRGSVKAAMFKSD